jgi:D-sedoheptulose 7-phosphate isomerase
MNFIESYIHEVKIIAESLDMRVIEQMVDSLTNLKARNGRLFILGVGGSAANASHAVNDFRKLTKIESYAPTDNVAEITARTNDEGWETVFDSYLEVSNLSDNDCILILSVGGGSLEKKVSVNLCHGIDFAKSRGALVLGIVGRADGYTQKHSDACLVIPNINSNHITPHSEAFQVIIWHLLVTHPKLKVNQTKW